MVIILLFLTKMKLLLNEYFITNFSYFQAAGIWYQNRNVAPSYWKENVAILIGRRCAAKRAKWMCQPMVQEEMQKISSLMQRKL